MLGDEWAEQRQRATSSDVQDEATGDGRATERRHRSLDDGVARWVETDRDAFARPRVRKCICVVQGDRVRLVVEREHELRDEVGAENAVEIVAQLRRELLERDGERHRLRESGDARQSEGRALYEGADDGFGADAANVDWSSKGQAQFPRAVEIDNRVLVAGVEDEGERPRAVDRDAQEHVLADELERERHIRAEREGGRRWPAERKRRSRGRHDRHQGQTCLTMLGH